MGGDGYKAGPLCVAVIESLCWAPRKGGLRLGKDSVRYSAGRGSGGRQPVLRRPRNGFEAGRWAGEGAYWLYWIKALVL